MRFLRRFRGISKPHELRSTFDVTGSINNFLNNICFSGYLRNAENQIVRANFTIQFCIAYLMITLITGCVVFNRIIVFPRMSWSFVNCIEFVNQCVSGTFVVVSMFAAYKCDIARIREYFNNYDHIDRVVEVSGTSFYTSEKEKYTRLFFLGTMGYAIKLTIEFVHSARIIKWAIIGYLDYLLSTCAIFIKMLSITVKLAILKDRFEMFGNRLSAALETPWKENPDDYVDIILQLKHGYQLFYKQLVVLSKVHGWQILFGAINIQLFLIVTVYGSFAPVILPWTYFATAFVQIFFSGGILYAMASCFEEILTVRKRMISQLEEAVLSMEINLVHQSEDKEIHRQVKTLLKQIRRQPLSFSICKIFQLDYSMIQSILSFTMTYIIVLAQLNKDGYQLRK